MKDTTFSVVTGKIERRNSQSNFNKKKLRADTFV